MNFRLKKHRFCWSRKLYSSLNVTLTYFLDQSMKLHVLRQNQDFCCWFLLFDKWKQLMLMFCLLPFNTFYLELYLCHTNTGFLRMAMARNFFFNWCFADPWSQDWVRSVHVKEKPSDRSILQGRWNQLEQEKIIRCPFFGCKHGINHCPISLYHHIIKSS